MQIIAETDDGATGHPSAVRSAQTVKICPMLTPADARFAIYVAFTSSRVTSLFRSLSNATTVQPRAARAMALRPYPQGASITGPLPESAIWSANLTRVFDGVIGSCAVAVFTARTRPVCG